MNNNHITFHKSYQNHNTIKHYNYKLLLLNSTRLTRVIIKKNKGYKIFNDFFSSKCTLNLLYSLLLFCTFIKARNPIVAAIPSPNIIK